jgi:hypothetical protein
MEKVNNNMVTLQDFYEHVKRKNQSGFSLKDAEQMCLWLFCILDVRPVEYRDVPIGRPELRTIFARFANEGYITTDLTPLRQGGKRPTDETYWDGLIDDFVFKRVQLDEDFRRRISDYL